MLMGSSEWKVESWNVEGGNDEWRNGMWIVEGGGGTMKKNGKWNKIRGEWKEN